MSSRVMRTVYGRRLGAAQQLIQVFAEGQSKQSHRPGSPSQREGAGTAFPATLPSAYTPTTMDGWTRCSGLRPRTRAQLRQPDACKCKDGGDLDRLNAALPQPPTKTLLSAWPATRSPGGPRCDSSAAPFEKTHCAICCRHESLTQPLQKPRMQAPHAAHPHPQPQAADGRYYAYLYNRVPLTETCVPEQRGPGVKTVPRSPIAGHLRV